jgi:rubrerythrin
MPKFKVEVEVTARCRYTVELEADGEGCAEDDALKLWRSKLPDDFQVEKGYIDDWDTEVEQLTWECTECGAEISQEQSDKGDGLCPACDAKMKAEESSA